MKFNLILAFSAVVLLLIAMVLLMDFKADPDHVVAHTKKQSNEIEPGIPIPTKSVKQNRKTVVHSKNSVPKSKFFLLAEPHNNKDHFFIKNSKTDRSIYLDDVDNVLEFITQSGAEHFSLKKDDQFQVLSNKIDQKGNVFYKFQQHYRNVEVFNRQIVVQTRSNGSLSLISGHFHNRIEIETAPELSAERALALAIESLPEESILSGAPKLVVYIHQGDAVLAYQDVVQYSNIEDLNLPQQLPISRSGFHKEKIFVDAHTGALLNLIPIVSQ